MKKTILEQVKEISLAAEELKKDLENLYNPHVGLLTEEDVEEVESARNYDHFKDEQI